MSGLEITGVVLGALPLVISALEHYAEGVNTAKRYWRFKSELRSLLLQIKTERGIFVNTLEQLLTGIVRIERMTEFVSNAGGDGWREEQIESQLKDRLRNVYEVYMDNIRGMESAIGKMMEKLALDPDGNPHFNDIHLFKQEYKRLKFSISKAEYADQITQLRHCNQALARLTKQSIELEPTRSSRSRSAPNFGALQKYARNVFETLRGGLGCSGGCHGHSLKLRLERRHERLESEEDLPQKTQFRVIFTPTLRTQWQEAEIRCIVDLPANTNPPQSTLNPHPKQRTVHFDHISVGNRYANTGRGTTMTVVRSSVITASGPTPNPIPKLCVALGHLHQQQVDSCLGYILDSEQRKQGIFPIAIQDNCPQRQYMAYSLRQILADPTTAGRRLTQHDKLKVALELSSSTLQLYKTPWLDERWGEDDVYFVLKPGATPLTLYEHPYVHRQFSQSNIATPQTQQPKYRIIRNQTLYSLGILLIELWYGKSMEQLQAPLDVDCAGTPGVAWCTAERLVDNELEFEAGKRYSDAVRRCIRCDFDRSDMSLDNESFQQAVFEGVVLPLETTLQQFSGQLS